MFHQVLVVEWEEGSVGHQVEPPCYFLGVEGNNCIPVVEGVDGAVVELHPLNPSQDKPLQKSESLLFHQNFDNVFDQTITKN